MFNLIVLIGGTYQIRLSGGSQTALVYTASHLQPSLELLSVESCGK